MYSTHLREGQTEYREGMNGNTDGVGVGGRMKGRREAEREEGGGQEGHNNRCTQGTREVAGRRYSAHPCTLSLCCRGGETRGGGGRLKTDTDPGEDVRSLIIRSLGCLLQPFLLSIAEAEKEGTLTFSMAFLFIYAACFS